MSDGQARSAENSPGEAAFFDVDGTLVSTHIVHQYVFARKMLAHDRGWASRMMHPLWFAAFTVRCLQYLYLDRVSRTRMNIAFYRNYANLPADGVRAVAGDCLERVLKPNLFPAGFACVGEHLKAGRHVVLVTGSIDFFIAPLAQHFAQCHDVSPQSVRVLARTLVEREGRFTGALDGPPIGEGEKAEVIQKYAHEEGIALDASYAYGDSIADLAMLETVGNPVAINADSELTHVASERGWPALTWKKNAGDG